MAKNYFMVEGLAPVYDHRWYSATPGQRMAFFRVCRELVLIEWDKQIANGIGRNGIGLAALSPKTIRYRKSAVGVADPLAPPLIPAHELSRTRSYVDARIIGNSIQVFWRKGFGRILGYHRDGSKRLPVRDVFGLSPNSKAEVLKQAHLWWEGYISGLAVRAPVRPRPGVAARPVVAVQPKYEARQPMLHGIQPTTTTNVVLGGDIYSMSSGSAKELLGAIRTGQFRGFKSYAK